MLQSMALKAAQAFLSTEERDAISKIKEIAAPFVGNLALPGDDTLASMHELVAGTGPVSYGASMVAARLQQALGNPLLRNVVAGQVPSLIRKAGIEPVVVDGLIAKVRYLVPNAGDAKSLVDLVDVVSSNVLSRGVEKPTITCRCPECNYVFQK